MKKHFLQALPLCASLFLSSPLFAQKEVPLKTIDQIAQNTLAYWRVPGCSIAIIQNGKTTLAKGYGIKKIDSQEPIDANTLFPIASLTKPFTALLVGAYVDSNQLQWDDPIRTFYPSLQLSNPYAASHLTFRDCLSMHSGLPGPTAELFIWENPKITTEELLTKILPKLPFTFGFRGAFAYQNLLYLLVAKALETKEKKSFHQLLREQIFVPLKMDQTLSQFSLFTHKTNVASPHQWEQDHFQEIPFENLDAIAPAAGIISSANDLSKWMIALSDSSLLDLDTLQTLFTPQTIATVKGFLPPNQQNMGQILFPDHQFLTYSLGSFVHDYRGIKMIQVPGISDGFAAVMAIIPDLNLSISILANGESPPFVRALLFQIIDAYLGKKTDWNTRLRNLLHPFPAHTSTPGDST